MKPARKSVRRTRKSAEPTPKSQVIALPPDCTLHNIATLKERLCDVAADVSNVTLDLRQLRQFDTTAFQLISAFARDMAARGTNLLTCGNSASWDEAARLLGLTSVLNAQV